MLKRRSEDVSWRDLNSFSRAILKDHQSALHFLRLLSAKSASAKACDDLNDLARADVILDIRLPLETLDPDWHPAIHFRP